MSGLDRDHGTTVEMTHTHHQSQLLLVEVRSAELFGQAELES